MSGFAALLAGLVFGFGLVVSGMSDPDNVLAFLRLDHAWNPALILVMASAFTITAIGYYAVRKRSGPIWGGAFRIPTATAVDAKLVVGASLFGIGWGLSGYCPGPAIVAAFQIDARALAFLAAFLVGLGLHELVTSRLGQQASATSADG